MDPLLITATSGMKARMDSLDMLANNIANSGTAGFKTDREFYSLYEQSAPGGRERQWTDFSQGQLTPTGNPLNLALSGKGFFALNAPIGTIYTRSGNFQRLQVEPAGDAGRLHAAQRARSTASRSRSTQRSRSTSPRTAR